MYLLLSLIGFFISLIYAIKAYFPNFYDTIVAILEIGMHADTNASTFSDDDDIWADSPSRGMWDETSMYYSSSHDDISSSSTNDD
jgi:hypothetical protein